jgi:gluconolactonase
VRWYAQTNLQLFNQLRAAGYSANDMALIRDAYECAMELFAAHFTSSGRSLISHVVGSASITAMLRFPAQAVAASLLHNVYVNGDFGDGRSGIARSRRRTVRRCVGREVEEYVARFSGLYWQPCVIQTARRDPDALDPIDRTVLVILFAEHLDHLLHGDILYYSQAAIDFYLDHSKLAAEIATRFQLPVLAAELQEAICKLDTVELPVHLSLKTIMRPQPVLAPASCRKRLSATIRQQIFQARSRVRSGNRRRWNGIWRRPPGSFAKLRDIWRWSRSNRLESSTANFAALFPECAGVQLVATGFEFTEGPAWMEERNTLLFSDIPGNRILQLASDGGVTIFRTCSGKSNGLTRDKQGRLIACEHGNRRVTRTESDGTMTILADKYQGGKLNSPNDVVVKSDGAIYFTDPSYGIKTHQQEQPVEGVYRISADGKKLSLVCGDFERPNGLAFSPDETILYIDDSKRCHIRAFKVEDDGSLSGGFVFHDMNISTPGAPDGMKVDQEGRVYCTGAGGVWVFEPDGKHLGTIVVPEKPSNCAWGDSDWRSLYITARTSVYRMRVTTPGVPVP